MNAQELREQAIKDGELVEYNGYWHIGPYSCKRADEVLAAFRRNGGKTWAEQQIAQAQAQTEAQAVRDGIKRLQDLHAWEQTLQPGDLVEVRWTNCYAYYGAQAQIVRVNKASVTVALAEAVKSQIGFSGYPVGHKINVPRVMAQTWSVNNGIRPIPQPAPVPVAPPPADPPMALASTYEQPSLFAVARRSDNPYGVRW